MSTSVTEAQRELNIVFEPFIRSVESPFDTEEINFLKGIKGFFDGFFQHISGRSSQVIFDVPHAFFGNLKHFLPWLPNYHLHLVTQIGRPVPQPVSFFRLVFIENQKKFSLCRVHFLNQMMTPLAHIEIKIDEESTVDNYQFLLLTAHLAMKETFAWIRLGFDHDFDEKFLSLKTFLTA